MMTVDFGFYRTIELSGQAQVASLGRIGRAQIVLAPFRCSRHLKGPFTLGPIIAPCDYRSVVGNGKRSALFKALRRAARQPSPLSPLTVSQTSCCPGAWRMIQR